MNTALPASLPRIVVLLFSILLLGAIFLFRQRMLFVDPCFVTFQIINTGELVITEHRYGAFITQMVPLIGANLHLPLNIILILYSASFYIFFGGVALVLIYAFNQYGLALLMAFYFTLFVSDVYYWPNNEVHQGIAWMFLFLGLALSNIKHRSVWKHAGMVATAFLAIFSHFIVIVPLSFLWIYLIIDGRHWKLTRRQTIIYSIGILVLFLIKLKLGSTGWYDGEKLQAVMNPRISDIISSFSNGHAKTFIHLLISNYWTALFIFIAGMVSMLLKRKFLLTAVTAFFSVIFFVLLGVTFPAAFGRELLFYMESQWMAFGILFSAPFVFHFLPNIKKANVVFMIVSIFIIRLIYIGNAGVLFDARLQKVERKVEDIRKRGDTKVLLRSQQGMTDEYLMLWGLPVESLMVSALHGDKPQVTFKAIGENEKIPTGKDTFYSSFRKMHVREINPFYFRIDTMQSYKIFSGDQHETE